MKQIAIAAFRPLSRDIAVILGRPGDVQHHCLDLEAARDLHGSLTDALRVAGCVDQPVSAVEGAGEP